MENKTDVGFGAGERALVVEDDKNVADMLRSLLKDMGLSCDVVYSAEDALDSLTAKPFDLVLSDIVLPGIDGRVLLRKIRELSIPVDVMLITAFAEEFTFLDAIREGANDFVTKPFHPKELEAKIYRVLRERRLLKTLKDSEARYRNLFRLSADGVLIVEPETGSILEANESFVQSTGFSEPELLQRNLFQFFPEASLIRAREALDICVAKGVGKINDIPIRKKTEETLFADLSITVVQLASKKTLLCVVRDVTELHHLQQQLLSFSLTDGLTKLYNHRHFQEVLLNEVVRSRRQRRPLSLLLMDVDNFKHHNDTFGHLDGDKVLAGVGESILQGIRGHVDAGFRYGGDEFAVLLPEATGPQAVKVAERIKGCFAKLAFTDITLSIGVTEYDGQCEPSQLVDLADKAMYAAKRRGGGQIALSEGNQPAPLEDNTVQNAQNG